MILSSRRTIAVVVAVLFCFLVGNGVGRRGSLPAINRLKVYLYGVFLGARLFWFRFQHVLEDFFRCSVGSVFFLLLLRWRFRFAAEEICVRGSSARQGKFFVLFWFDFRNLLYRNKRECSASIVLEFNYSVWARRINT